MNVILQPVHLLLYMSLISTASDLVTRNPIYALVAIGFLIPAEKFIKRMFGLDKASTTSDFGTFAKNALMLEGLKKVGSAFSGGESKSTKAIKTANDASQAMESSKFNKIRRAELGAFSENNGELDENNKKLTKEDQKQLGLNSISDEKEKLKQQLDEYENNGGDLYSSMDPEIQAKQLRYQELDEQERLAKEYNQQKENDKIDNMPNVREGYKRRILGRTTSAVLKGALKGGLSAAKGAAKVGLTAAGAIIGVASAISTGDASKVAQYALSGAYASNKIGKGISNMANSALQFGQDTYRNIGTAIDNVQDIYNEEKYGYSAARDVRVSRENEKARKQFLKDKEQERKWLDIAGKIGCSGEETKKIMNTVADYKEAGIDDEMIENALKVEKSKDGTIGGNNHDKLIDVASFATKNGYKKSDILSEKSRSDMEDVVESTVSEKNRYEVMKNIADLYGQGNFYSKKSRFKK